MFPTKERNLRLSGRTNRMQRRTLTWGLCPQTPGFIALMPIPVNEIR